MEITLNDEQRLFVISVPDGGYTCHGFDVVYLECQELARRIRKVRPGIALPTIQESEIGTLAQYAQYRELIEILGDRKTGTWFKFDTPGPVRSVLERYRKDGGVLRIFYGDRNTGRCWMEENDVLGEIGRSCGRMQIPLLIKPGESGGGGILDNCIVRMIDGRTRIEQYRQRNYYLPEIEIRPVDAALGSGYTHGAWVKSKEDVFECHANFRSYGKAAQWVAFMAGECCEQP